MKEDPVKKEIWILWIGMIGMAMIFQAHAWAAQPSSSGRPSQKLLPVKVEVLGVERLNDIAANPPFQKTDTLVFRVNFRLINPNKALAKVEDLEFEVKVEDGTPDKTIVFTSSMPASVIQGQGEMTWSCTEPYIYAGVLGSYILRGVGGEDGVKGAAQKLEELWKDLGADKKKFLIEGKISSSLADFPGLGIVQQRFSAEFEIPKL